MDFFGFPGKCIWPWKKEIIVEYENFLVILGKIVRFILR